MSWFQSIKNKQWTLFDNLSQGSKLKLNLLILDILKNQVNAYGIHFLLNNQLNNFISIDGYDNYQAPLINNNYYLRRMWVKGSLNFFHDINYKTIKCIESISLVRTIGSLTFVTIKRRFDEVNHKDYGMGVDEYSILGVEEGVFGDFGAADGFRADDDFGVDDLGVKEGVIRDTGVTNADFRKTGVKNADFRKTGVKNADFRDTGVINTDFSDLGADESGPGDFGVINSGLEIGKSNNAGVSSDKLRVEIDSSDNLDRNDNYTVEKIGSSVTSGNLGNENNSPVSGIDSIKRSVNQPQILSNSNSNQLEPFNSLSTSSQSTLLLCETRTLVYTNELYTPVSKKSKVLTPDISQEISINATHLLKYSMLTYNLHKIHYDPEYCKVENLPGIIVHGPFMVTLLLSWFKINFKDKEIKSFDYKNIQPCFIDKKLKLGLINKGQGVYNLFITNLDGDEKYIDGTLMEVD